MARVAYFLRGAASACIEWWGYGQREGQRIPPQRRPEERARALVSR